jgi:hypothetical protein
MERSMTSGYQLNKMNITAVDRMNPRVTKRFSSCSPVVVPAQNAGALLPIVAHFHKLP